MAEPNKCEAFGCVHPAEPGQMFCQSCVAELPRELREHMNRWGGNRYCDLRGTTIDAFLANTAAILWLAALKGHLDDEDVPFLATHYYLLGSYAYHKQKIILEDEEGVSDARPAT